jgi:hypothetical protein
MWVAVPNAGPNRAVTGSGQNGAYPTLNYDDALVDDSEMELRFSPSESAISQQLRRSN